MLHVHSYFAETCPAGNGNAIINSNSLPHTCANSNTLNTAMLIAFGIIGAISVLFLIIGGFRYITSGGSPENVQKAKNQILYSLIGLVIAGLASAIVNFVTGRL